jgi:carbon-monoxide dehydrogenase medium subunit
VGVAAALAVKDRPIVSARVGLTGACPSAVRLAKVEQSLAGKPLSQATMTAASKDAAADLPSVNADLHASEEYRRAMVDVFTRRALEAAMQRA